MAADLIIYAVVAAALIFWLKTILGTKNGEERERPNPFAPKNDNGTPQEGNVIDLPRPANTGAPIRVTKTTLTSRVKIETPDAENGLRAIAAVDSSFNLDRFMEGAEYAFELIVTSFAKGDRDTLKNLLTPNVYNDFDRAITDRTVRGETVDTKIEAVRGMDIISATVKGNIGFVSIRFTAQETCIIRNAAGAVVAGDADKTTTMIDIWTFGRDLNSASPVWYLYETRDEHMEHHKTPLPESR